MSSTKRKFNELHGAPSNPIPKRKRIANRSWWRIAAHNNVHDQSTQSLGVAENCMVHQTILNSSRPFCNSGRRVDNSTKSTSNKTSHSFSPRKYVKHQILQRLLNIFISNVPNQSMLILHPFTGHFMNTQGQLQSDGSSKVIIDTILNHHRSHSEIRIQLIFIEIFVNSLFSDIHQYLKKQLDSQSTLQLDAHVFHCSVEHFFGLKDESFNLYDAMMESIGCQDVFWFLDPYKMEKLLSPEKLHLHRILRNDIGIRHFVYFLLFIGDLKRTKRKFKSDRDGDIFKTRNEYLSLYSDHWNTVSIRIINKGAPNYDLVYLYDSKLQSMEAKLDIFGTFVAFNCHQYNVCYLRDNAFSEKYYKSHDNGNTAVMEAICHGVGRNVFEGKLEDIQLLISICKCICMFCE